MNATKIQTRIHEDSPKPSRHGNKIVSVNINVEYSGVV